MFIFGLGKGLCIKTLEVTYDREEKDNCREGAFGNNYSSVSNTLINIIKYARETKNEELLNIIRKSLECD